MMNKHEVISAILLILGISVLIGMWLGFMAFPIAVMVGYVLIGASNGDCSVNIWTWPLDPFKKSD